MGDSISRQAAIGLVNDHTFYDDYDDTDKNCLIDGLRSLPSAQLERLTDDDFETIRIHLNAYKEKLCNQHRWKEAEEYQRIIDRFMAFASAQPEQRCVNCGRTVNNGGWYEDGRTRCPIEEHYALPKDGYCHLWEKKKVWEDDYAKRPEEGESDG